jgi:hypothetical protein
VRGWIPAAVLALALAGCGATSGDAGDEGSADERRPSAASAVESCTERLLAQVPEAEKETARRYVEDTYCSRFAERGWVHEDGALRIEAHKWLEEGGEEECEAATQPGDPAETVPCEQLDTQGSKTIDDCGLLHHVRRSEVEDYLEELRRRHGDVECEDGTPLAELGAP